MSRPAKEFKEPLPHLKIARYAAKTVRGDTYDLLALGGLAEAHLKPT